MACNFSNDYEPEHDKLAENRGLATILEENGVEIIEELGAGVQGTVYKIIYNKAVACAKFFRHPETMSSELKMLKTS